MVSATFSVLSHLSKTTHAILLPGTVDPRLLSKGCFTPLIPAQIPHKCAQHSCKIYIMDMSEELTRELERWLSD